MSAPLPIALRSRFCALLEEGKSARLAASQLKISASTGVRWAQLIRRDGHAAIAPQGRPKGSGKLAPFAPFFEELIAQDGDITLPELASALEDAHGVQVYSASIARFLSQHGFTYKKIAGRARAAKRKGEIGGGEWFNFRLPAIQKSPESVVFIDETSVKTNLTRLRGWAPKGERLNMDAPFGAWGTQTLIAGMTHDAFIAPWVIKGAMNGEAFATYISEVLVPEIPPRTVVICDNLATHKNKAAAEALHSHGCWFLFLPPYSPDLNPIEMAFSKLKAHLRRIGARTFEAVFKAIGEICDMFSDQECGNYFKASGYEPC